MQSTDHASRRAIIARVPFYPFQYMNVTLLLWFILLRATEIEDGEDHLKNNKSISPCVHAPNHPKDIAGKKRPKTEIAMCLSLRANQPRCGCRERHGRPLDEIDIIHDLDALPTAGLFRHFFLVVGFLLVYPGFYFAQQGQRDPC